MLRVPLRAAVLALLVALVAGAPTFAAPSGATDGDAPGFARARAWFESLGYPDVRKLPFVRVWTGSYLSTSVDRGGESRRVELFPELGWLTADEGKTFRVFSTELRIDRFARRDVPDRPEMRVGYDRIDLAETVRDGLAALARLSETEKTRPFGEPPPSPMWKETDPFGDTTMMPPYRFKGFVLACACAQTGHEDLALALWRRLAAEAPWPPKPTWTVLDDLRSAIGYVAHENLVLDLYPQEGSWADRLAEHRRWLERFPGHPDTDEVRAEIAALEKNVRVEAARAKRPARAWETLEPAERADDLVDRLVDPFAFLIERIDGDTLAGRGQVVPSPDTWVLPRLIALGEDAVPRLIEALSDDRWTRSVSLGSGVMTAGERERFYVERVADLALVALGAITGQDFSEQHRIERRAFMRGPGDTFLASTDPEATRARARAWWALHAPSVPSGK